jgi:hypothetical protein
MLWHLAPREYNLSIPNMVSEPVFRVPFLPTDPLLTATSSPRPHRFPFWSPLSSPSSYLESCRESSADRNQPRSPLLGSPRPDRSPRVPAESSPGSTRPARPGPVDLLRSSAPLGPSQPSPRPDRPDPPPAHPRPVLDPPLHRAPSAARTTSHFRAAGLRSPPAGIGPRQPELAVPWS